MLEEERRSWPGNTVKGLARMKAKDSVRNPLIMSLGRYLEIPRSGP
jgi:hypothetical protein